MYIGEVPGSIPGGRANFLDSKIGLSAPMYIGEVPGSIPGGRANFLDSKNWIERPDVTSGRFQVRFLVGVQIFLIQKIGLSAPMLHRGGSRFDSWWACKFS
jgi:hypothetical protein